MDPEIKPTEDFYPVRECPEDCPFKSFISRADYCESVPSQREFSNGVYCDYVLSGKVAVEKVRETDRVLAFYPVRNCPPTCLVGSSIFKEGDRAEMNPVRNWRGVFSPAPIARLDPAASGQGISNGMNTGGELSNGVNHTHPSYEKHIVIIPKEHVAKLIDVKDKSLIGEIFGIAEELIREFGLDGTSYRLVTNGGVNQESKHLHFHLVSGERVSVPAN